MKKKRFLLVSLGIFFLGAVILFKYVKNNNEKLIYAIHSMSSIEKSELEKKIKEFSETNPGITVELKEYRRSYSDIKSGINSPTEPIDLFVLPYPLLPIYAKTDLIMPMTEYHGIKKTAQDPSWEAYAYPKISPPDALLFNKEFIKYSKKRLPKTHQELQDILQELSDAGVQYPFVVDTYIHEYLNDPELNDFILKTLTKTDVFLYNELFQKNLMAKTSDVGEENRYEAFLNRKAVFIVSSMEGIRYIENEDSSLNFGSIAIPEVDGSYEQLLNSNRYVIGKNSKNPDLVFKLIEFLNDHN